ncbi:helix-turn-helix domain-containing protein [Methylobacterium tarhaniae]
MISKIERGVAAPSFSTIEKISEILDVPEVYFFGIGLVIAADGDRSRIISKINTRMSRLSEEQLVRIDKMIKAVVD